MTLSTLIHNQTQRTELDRARRWLTVHYQDYLEDTGAIDADALAAALARDFGLLLATAEDVTAEFVREMDKVK